MWLLLLEPALLPSSGDQSPHSLIMPADEQGAFPSYEPAFAHSHKAVPGVLNLLALSPAERREKRRRNRKQRELEKQNAAATGGSSINLRPLPGGSASVDAFTATSQRKTAAQTPWTTRLYQIIDEQRKEGSWFSARSCAMSKLPAYRRSMSTAKT